MMTIPNLCEAIFRQRRELSHTMRGAVTLALTLTALTAPGISPAVEMFKTSGPSASASFTSTDGCIVTYAYVYASTAVTRQSATPGALQSATDVQAYVIVVKSDQCSYTLLVDGTGSGPIDPSAFQVSQRLDAATLKATVSVYDSVSDSFIDVNVDVTWTATGDPGRSTVIEHVAQAGQIFQQKMTGTTRVADAAGTVSDGITNFSPEPTSVGYLQNVSTGNVTIYKPNGAP